MKNLVVVVVAAVLAAAGFSVMVGCGSGASAEPDVPASATTATNVAATEKPAKSEAGMPAMEKAAAAKKYLFALFLKENDSAASAMRVTLQDVMKKVADKADSVEVDVTASSEKAIVDKFDLDRAPMPLILAIAPSGAVMGGFPTKVTKQDLLDSFASLGTEKCMVQLQKNRLVLLCVQNEKTKSNEEAMKGVRDFKADARFASATEIITINPEDVAEATLLSDLKVDPRTSQAVTVVLAPPGQPIATFVGAMSADQIVAKVAAAQSGPCANGQCGPGGCGPKK